MRKFLTVIGSLTLCLTVGAVALVLWSHSEGSRNQERFFSAVSSGDPASVSSLFHPTLKDEVDEPVLGEWMRVLSSKLGGFKGLSKGNFNTKAEYADGRTVTISEGTVLFDRGEAASKLTLEGDRVVAFDVTSPLVSGASIPLPEDSSFYRARGLALLDHLMRGRYAEARAMFHQALQLELPADMLAHQMQALLERSGELVSIEALSEKKGSEQDAPSLDLLYKVKCRKASLHGNVKFHFSGFKGHIMAFNLRSEDGTAEDS